MKTKVLLNFIEYQRFVIYMVFFIVGRCKTLFNEKVCLKSLEMIFQWSLAGVAVKSTSYTLQKFLLE